MNKIKKILIFVTCLCFSFVFLFSINFAHSDTVKAEYNLFNYEYFYDTLNIVNSNNISYETKDDRTCIKISSPASYQNVELYKGEYIPNVAYTFSIEFYLEAIEQDVGLLPYIKYTDGSELGLLSNTFNTWAEFSVTTDPNKTIDSISITYGVPSTISYFNVNSMTLSYFDTSLGSIYEQGFVDGSRSPLLPDIDDDFYEHNLVSLPNHTAITVNQLFYEYKTSFVFEPNVTYIFSLRFDVANTTASGLKFIVGYGDSAYFIEQLGVGFMTGSPNDIIMITFTTPEVFQVSTPFLWLREIDHSVLHTTSVFVSDIFLRYYSKYEYGHSIGYSNGYSDGLSDGYNAGSSDTLTTNWFTSFLSSTFDILNIDIFPNIKLIYLIFIPVGLGVLALILKMARG